MCEEAFHKTPMLIRVFTNFFFFHLRNKMPEQSKIKWSWHWASALAYILIKLKFKLNLLPAFYCWNRTLHERPPLGTTVMYNNGAPSFQPGRGGQEEEEAFWLVTLDFKKEEEAFRLVTLDFKKEEEAFWLVTLDLKNWLQLTENWNQKRESLQVSHFWGNTE